MTERYVRSIIGIDAILRRVEIGLEATCQRYRLRAIAGRRGSALQATTAGKRVYHVNCDHSGPRTQEMYSLE